MSLRLVPDVPFPPYAFVPGRAPHPVSDPAGHSVGVRPPPACAVEPDRWATHRVYLYGLDLFNAGYYWESHVEFESIWMACGRRGPTADFLKGLIKLAAAGVKHREGRPAGVKSHSTRAAELFRAAAPALGDEPGVFLGLSLGRLIELADAVGRSGWPADAPLLLPDRAARAAYNEGGIVASPSSRSNAVPHLNPLSDAQASPEAQPLFQAIQAKFKAVPNIFRTMGHSPAVLKATLDLNQSVQHDLDPKLRELAYLKASQINHCRYCLHYHKMGASKAGLSEGQIAGVEGYENNAAYDDLQKDVLRFAEQWTARGKVDPAVLLRLNQKLTPAQVVTLAATVGLANWTNRFNETFGIELP